MSVLFPLNFAVHLNCVFGKHFRYISNFVRHVVNIVEQKEWSKYRALRHTTLYMLPVKYAISEDNSLMPVCQERLNRWQHVLSFDSILPEDDESFVGKGVKGFGKVQVDSICSNFLSYFLVQSFKHSRSWVAQEHLSWKPCCSQDIVLFLVTSVISLKYLILGPFLKRGVMFASRQSWGVRPVCLDWLKMKWNG